jgi:cellulose biosynthesis protein BcsQ
MDSLGQILTFYSYKGGVGRSMGLVNVAVLLAKWKRKVLMIDWDLEAPGLESYFEAKTNLSEARLKTPGIIDLVQAPSTDNLIDWHECIIPVKLSGQNPSEADIELNFISAGKSDEHYISKVQHTDWEELFNTQGLGHHLEELRNAWKEEFDFILIDSRTGITDIGGVCTIHLPDMLVIWFTTNETNVKGAKHVSEQARVAHDQLPFDRNPLVILPVPSRDENRQEVKKAAEWLKYFAKELGAFYEEWLPKDIGPTEAIEKLRIPYIPYWSFGEGLPVVEEDVSGLSNAYETLARLLFFNLSWNEIDRNPEQSVDYLRRAAAVDLDQFGPELADALFDRALELWRQQLRDETTETTKEAVRIWETLAAKDLTPYEIKLARAKKLLSELLQDSDEPEAVNQAKDAVDSYLKLSVQDQTKLREEIATSLVELSERIHTAEPELAINTLTKAIDILRNLSRSIPRFEMELARTLHDLADWYIEEKQFSKGLDAIQESVSLYRRLAKTNRDRFAPDLADSLITHSECLLETGSLESAMTDGHEAVEIYKTLVAENPKRYESALVKTFNALLDILSRSDTSIGSMGINAIEDAVAFFRGLAQKDPQRYEFELAKALDMLPEALSKEGRISEALETQKEAVEIFRHLRTLNPTRYDSDFAQTLLGFSRLLSSHSRISEATVYAREAAQIFELLAKDSPAGFSQDLEEAIKLANQN